MKYLCRLWMEIKNQSAVSCVLFFERVVFCKNSRSHLTFDNINQMITKIFVKGTVEMWLLWMADYITRDYFMRFLTYILFVSIRTTISNNVGYGLAIWINETTVNYPVRQETLLSYSNFSLNYDIGALVRKQFIFNHFFFNTT